MMGRTRCYKTVVVLTLIFSVFSGVDTGGSGDSMNLGPKLLGAPSAEPQKILCKKIISLLAYTSGSGKQTTNYKVAKFTYDYNMIFYNDITGNMEK